MSAVDVHASLGMGPTFFPIDVLADNPMSGTPTLTLLQSRARGTVTACSPGKMSFDPLQTFVWDDGVLEYTVKRLPDDDWKQFVVTLHDSANPTADGGSRPCR